MKAFLILSTALSIVSCSVKTQKVKNTFLKVSYTNYREINDSIFFENYKGQAKELYDFNYSLLTQKEYYDLFFNEKESIYKRVVGLDGNKSQSFSGGKVTSHQSESYLFRNYEEDFTLLTSANADYLIRDESVDIQWTITNEEKTILGYKVQKATADGLEKGSNMVAWFTKEIPIDVGPYLYNGLPGLILEVEIFYDPDEETLLNEIKSAKLLAQDIENHQSTKTLESFNSKEVISRSRWEEILEQNKAKRRLYKSGGVDTSD